MNLDKCFSCQLHLSVLSFLSWVCFRVLYIATLYIFVPSFPIYGSACADTTLKMSTSEVRDHVVYNSWFSYTQKSNWPLLLFGSCDCKFLPRVTVTKIDSTFPTSQFLMSGYSATYRLDRNDKGGGFMLFVKTILLHSL